MEARELRETQRSRDTAVLEDIQRELAGIRAQLENLAGREFEYEPAALRAEARRIRELESVTLDEEVDEPAESEVPEPDTTRHFGAPSPDAVAGRLGQQPSRPQANPLADLINDTQVAETRRSTPGPSRPCPGSRADRRGGGAAVVESMRHRRPARGRRRCDENTGGLPSPIRSPAPRETDLVRPRGCGGRVRRPRTSPA